MDTPAPVNERNVRGSPARGASLNQRTAAQAPGAPSSGRVRRPSPVQRASWRAPGPNRPAATTSASTRPEGDEQPKFTPSIMALQRRGLIPGNDGEDKDELKKRHGISLAYGGDASAVSNRSAKITEGETTSLFLQNLPPTCSYRELLASFRSVGKIQSTHITPPGNGHDTSCAKVALYTRAAAEKLFRKLSRGQIIIRGYKPTVVWNRVWVAGYGEESRHSRIILIVGPEDQVSRGQVDKVLSENLVYDIDEIIDHGVIVGLARLEYRFGSYSCQAQFAMKAILANFDTEQVFAEFGRNDPCE